MKKAPYSLSEAQKICKEFQYLAGQRFDKDINADIDCVMITPFGEESKKRFFLYYMLFDDAEIALNHEFYGMLFDVVAVAGSKDGYELLQEDVYTWLAKNKSVPLFHAVISELVPQPVAIAAYQ